jgi:hypothetical protein
VNTKITFPALLSVIALLGLGSAGCASEAPVEGEGASSNALSTSANQHTAYSFFVGKGLSRIQSAAIVGNLIQESGVSPTIAQSGGPGRGIAQWSVGGRWDRTPGDNLHSFAASRGESATSLQAQLAFVWFELENFPQYGLERLQSAKTLSTAVVVFQTDFEVCGACNQSRRIQDAQSVLNAFGSEATPVDAPDQSAPSNGNTSDPSNTTAEEAGCYSPTLEKEMPANACVQSQTDSVWYQCSNGSWVPRETVAAACNGEFPL